MKIVITVMCLAAITLLWPSIFFLFSVGLPIFLIFKTGKKKMTKAEKRKAFNDEIMYY